MRMKLSTLSALTVVACMATAQADAATVNATISSDNVLQGNFQASGGIGTPVYLENNSNARRVGTGGAGSAQRVNQPVLGFTLPTIPAGDVVSGADFSITMDTTAVNGAPITFDMVVSLMDGTTFTGADFVEVPGPTGLGAGNAFVGSRAAGDVANDSVETFSLSGDALTLLAGLYDASGNPTQAEVFFRLSTSTFIDTTVADNANDRFNLARSGDPLQVTRSLTIQTVPEPSSAIALLAAGATLLVRRRK